MKLKFQDSKKGFAVVILLISTAVISIGLIYSNSIKHPRTPVINSTVLQSFSFSAAGDFSDSDEASKVLGKIPESGSDFTLALGDLGYVGIGNEEGWCDFVKSRVGSDYPFQLVAGNHDDGSRDGDISKYISCLPNKMENVVGEYGIEYYFDFNNLARFIMISPDIDNYGFDYEDDSEHLQWVIDTVKDARNKNVPWVVLGMHKNCITPGVKPCEIGEDLMNAAIEYGVDIVLQGHEHAYFRSKQLSLDPNTCPAIIVNEFNSACIANDSNDLKKGEGTVIVISGAGGYQLRDVNFSDPEFGYFSSINAKNTGNSHGFSLFNVSEKNISANFVPATGSFTDSFRINR